MSVLNPLALFAQTADMLANADCPHCGRKDLSACSPGRKGSDGCEWCGGRRQLLDQCRHWLHRSQSRALPEPPRSGETNNCRD